jgi:tetratricopeptide (TPR) repeat protein
VNISSTKSTASSRALIVALLCVLVCAMGAKAQVNARAERLERAAALIGGDRLAEAEQELNQVLKAAPEEEAALNLLGALRAKQGRLDEAEALFTRAVRSDRGLVGAHMNLAYLHLLKGEPEKSANALKEVLRIDPSNADAGYRLAWLLLSQGRFDECIGLVEQLKQTQSLSVALLDVLGDAYLSKGDAGRAEASYRLALDAKADDANALLGLAQLAQSRGDAKTASLYLGRVSGVANSPDLLYKLARVALGAGVKDEAVKALRRAVELRPEEAAYRFALGAAWLNHPPDLQEAELSFRQFLKLRPEDPQGQLHLGYVLLKQKKHAEARDLLEKSIQRGAGTPEAFYYLGLIAQGQGEDARAVELFEKATGLAPSFSSAHVALGSTYLKLKDYARAQQALETGVKLSPEDSKAHYNLALLYARLKNPERAQEEMRIVERLKNEGKAQADEEGDTLSPPRPL